jgi:hypothetical protein
MRRAVSSIGRAVPSYRGPRTRPRRGGDRPRRRPTSAPPSGRGGFATPVRRNEAIERPITRIR